MADDVVLFDIKDGLARISLNRPDKLNSLSVEVFQRLDQCIAQIEQAPDSVGCILMRGAGSCFSAGHDLGQIAEGEMLPYPNFQSLVLERLAGLPVPVVVAVHGHCYTGALELALAGDIILASANAKFADTHAKFGMTPKWGMSQRLPRKIGYAHAAELIFRASTISGARAAEIGLANHCFPDDRFDAEVAAFCRDIVDNSWFSHRSYKVLMRDTDGMDLKGGLAHEVLRSPGRDPEMPARIKAFMARKKERTARE